MQPSILLATITLFTIASAFLLVQMLRQRYTQQVVIMRRELQAAQQQASIVSERLSAEQERVEQLQMMLTSKQNHTSKILANMSHELRTPLNAIIGYSELLNSATYGELTPRQRDRLERIHANGLNLSQHVSDILDLYRLESDDVELNFAPTNIASILDITLAKKTQQAKQKGLTLIADVPPGLPSICADISMLPRAISELVDNALKFSDTGSITISVSYEQNLPSLLNKPISTSDNAWLIISVVDNGLGVQSHDADYIFEPFTQVDAGFNRQITGIGIGLSIAKRIVELHNGYLWLNPSDNAGTCFQLAIPAIYQSAPLSTHRQTAL